MKSDTGPQDHSVISRFSLWHRWFWRKCARLFQELMFCCKNSYHSKSKREIAKTQNHCISGSAVATPNISNLNKHLGSVLELRGARASQPKFADFSVRFAFSEAGYTGAWDKPALLLSLKRQVFFVGDSGIGLRWTSTRPATTTQSLLLIGRINDHERTYEANFWVSIAALQAGENSQSNDPEHTIISSILTDLSHLILRKSRKQSSISELINKPAKRPKFPNSKSIQEHHHSFQHKFLIFKALNS